MTWTKGPGDASALAGKPISTTSPTDGQVLVYNAATGLYEPGSVAGGWATLADIDFAAEGSQTLSPNGPYTIGGYTWTKINSANDLVAMAVVNGSGIVIQPTGASDSYGTTDTAPAIEVPITSIVSELQAFTPLRVSMYVGAINAAQNYDAVFVALRRYSGGIIQWAYQNYYAFINFAVRNAGWGYYAGSIVQGFDSAVDIGKCLQITLPSGIAGYEGNFARGTYAGGAATKAPRTLGVYNGAVGAAVANYTAVGAASEWYITIGAFRSGSVTVLSATVERLLVEAIL